jgi:hypothetical protein
LKLVTPDVVEETAVRPGRSPLPAVIEESLTNQDLERSLALPEVVMSPQTREIQRAMYSLQVMENSLHREGYREYVTTQYRRQLLVECRDVWGLVNRPAQIRGKSQDHWTLYEREFNAIKTLQAQIEYVGRLLADQQVSDYKVAVLLRYLASHLSVESIHRFAYFSDVEDRPGQSQVARPKVIVEYNRLATSDYMLFGIVLGLVWCAAVIMTAILGFAWYHFGLLP